MQIFAFCKTCRIDIIKPETDKTEPMFLGCQSSNIMFFNRDRRVVIE